MELVTDETVPYMTPHNPDAACARCCQQNEELAEIVIEMRKIASRFNPENAKEIPGAMGLIIRSLFKG